MSSPAAPASLFDLSSTDDPPLAPPGASRAPARFTPARGLTRPSPDRVPVPDDLHLTPPVAAGPNGASTGETAARWRAHLQAIFDYYAPVGRPEQLCAFRVASLFWRLDRAVRCETDELSHSFASAEHDAASLLSREDPLDPADPVARALPADPDALRHRLEQAMLAVKVLPDMLQVSGPDPLPEAHADAALRFVADYTAPRTTPTHAPAPLPPLPTMGYWSGASLRTGLSHLFANRALGDVITETIAYAKATAVLIEDRLERIETLAARLRRQYVVPHSHVADRALQYEAHLAAQLDLALRQLDTLQSARAQPS